MTSSVPMPMRVPVPVIRPRRRWWLPSAIAGAVFILAALGVPYYAWLADQQAWGEAEAEADRLDPRWRLLQLEADRQAVPDAENSAFVLTAIAATYPSFRSRPLVQNEKNYKKIFENVPPTAQLNHQQFQLMRGFLAKHAEPLAKLQKLKDMPRGRFPITYRDAFNVFNDSGAKGIALYDWLEHDAYCLAHDGQYDAAVESCQAIVNIGRSFGDEPSNNAIGHRYEMQGRAAVALERVLAQGEACDDVLQAIQALIALELKEDQWLRNLRVDRAGNHYFHDNVRAGKVKTEVLQGRCFYLNDGTWRGWVSGNFPSTLMAAYPESLRYMNRAVEIAKLPVHEQRAKYTALDVAAKNSGNYLMIFWLRLYDFKCWSEGFLRSTLVALACERYRLQHERWPASLDVLVQAKLLDAVPSDPMDNEPLRYRIKEDGVVIYCIGMDRADNDGRIENQIYNDPLAGFDAGFRLWDVSRRRQPPLPPVALPE